MPTGTKGGYEVGYGKPSRHAGFKKGQSGNPRAAARFEEPDDPAERRAERDGDDHRERPAQKITKREAVIKQLVNKSASADARSLKILLDLMLNLEARARASAAPTPAVGLGDEEVLAQLKARLEGAIRDQMATRK